jgi:hypothetical protein
MVTMNDYSATSVTRINVDNTFSATSSTYSDLNITSTDIVYTHANSNYNWHKEIDIDIIKKLIKKQIIQDMKDRWSQFILEKPVPKLRPLSLRGVCFSGRGWA